MQNSTLRFKGKLFYLLALTILIGSLPSMYGQSDCPEDGDFLTTQDACYLETIGDLDTAGYPVYQTDDNDGDTQPIPEDELLTDGTTYYVGGTSGDCDRIALTVNVDAAPVPENTIVPGSTDFSISPCSNSDFTAEDLASFFVPDTDYTIHVYTTEFGDTEASGQLTPGASYFVGQTSDSGCPSRRAAVGYDPNDPEAPTATSPQEYCEGATVADLMASGTYPNTQAIRWYRSMDANSPLAETVELIDGATYYASQVVNDRSSVFPPCESDERTPVEVTLIPADAGPDNTDNTLCVSEAEVTFADATSARNYYLSLLTNNTDTNPDNDVPTDGTFDPTIASIMSASGNGTIPGYYETTYTATFDGGCTDDVVLAVNIAEDPYAGEDTEETVCITDFESFLPLNPAFVGVAQAAVMDYIEGTDITPGGTFSPSIADLFDQINEDFNNDAFPQTYTVTYTVDNDGCMDMSTLTLNVQSANDAGEDASEELCETDVMDRGIFDDEASLRAYYINLLGAEDTDGTFSPALSTLIANYEDGVTEPSEDFGVTYTVDSSSECEPASANATLTVTAAIAAEAGSFTAQEYCSNEDAVNLFTLLSGDANPDGAFSSDDADVADGTFDPMAEGAGEYTITYTVSPETACVTSTDTAELTITVNQAPNAGPGGDFSFCQGEFEAIAAAVAANPTGMGMELLNELDPTITPGGMFSDDDLATLLAQYAAVSDADAFPATFTTTYTVSNDDCTDAASYSITVTPNTEADAGGDQEITFCTTDGDMDLSDYLGDGATMGGMFMSDDADVTDGMFDPSTEGAGTYEVTYTANGDDDPCVEGESTATLTITVVEGVDAGDDVSMVICENDLEDDFFTVENLSAYYSDLLGDDVPTTGTFEPSISELVDMYNGGMMTGDFTTVYTVGDGTCEDSVSLTVTIRENFNAEDLMDIEDFEVCQNADTQNLFNYIGENPDLGSFTLNGEEIPGGLMDPGSFTPGDYQITYSISESTPCVSGSNSVTFTVTVIDSANSGFDRNITYCENDASENLYDGLADFADQTGTFTIDGEEIENGIFDPAEYGAGTFEVLYSVPATNDCGDDVATYTITINSSPDAGEDMELSICQNAEIQDLFNLLEGSTSTDGEFTLDGNVITDGIMDPSDFEPGTYMVTYSLSNENCTDTAIFSITIQDAANAGEDMDLSVCMNAGVQNLFDFLSADADMNGEFTLDGDVITDGMMDPMDFAAGDYEVTYTVEAINDCGDDMSTFNITVQDAADAPTAMDMTFCASDMPMGADLTATGDNLMFYSDEDLTTMVMDDDSLMTGTYYVTQRTGDDSCESNATSFEVTVNDGTTPTIDNPSVSFCEYDDATVLDLTDAIDQTDNITWYDAATDGEMLSTGTALQDGVVYYASYTDPDSGCESSVRLAVTVSIENCPLVFPEGISPNGDGMNDTFTIENIDREYPNYTIEIYNRWGDVVYKGNASTPDWDGTNSQSGSLGDDVLPVGVYFYLLEFNDGATAPRRGKIYLSR